MRTAQANKDYFAPLRSQGSKTYQKPWNVGSRQVLSSAFTILEMLVSMALLAIIITVVANMYRDSSQAWEIGVNKAEVNTSGRAALEFMARELSQAVAGPIESAQTPPIPNLQFRQESESEIRFLALSQKPSVSSDYRSLRGVIFELLSASNQVRYCRKTSSPTFAPYKDEPKDWNYSGIQPLIQNVLDLQFYVYTNEEALVNGDYIKPPFPITLDRLPVCVDIFIELLSEDDMKRAGKGGSDFIARNAKCYSTRVYFPNRAGYQTR